MALGRILAAVCSRALRLAPLSTAAPKTREQPAAGRGAVRGRGAAEAGRPPVPTVDFDNAQEAYRSRRSWELARSLLVLRLCASPALLAHHEQVRAGRWAGRWAGGYAGPRVPLLAPGFVMTFRRVRRGSLGITCSEGSRGGRCFLHSFGPGILLHPSPTN